VATKFSKETYLYWYELMQLIRQFELKSEEMYKMAGKIRGFFHAYIGQEAIAAGCMTATQHDDPFITAYRDHGLALAKGVSADACMPNYMVKQPVVQRVKVEACTFLASNTDSLVDMVLWVPKLELLAV
jgi:TPP-dependent pyruvate/acetoin dehydrogenase alpha subunit